MKLCTIVKRFLELKYCCGCRPVDDPWMTLDLTDIKTTHLL